MNNTEWKLIRPSADAVEIFNAFWTENPTKTKVQLFDGGEFVDVKKEGFIDDFLDYEEKDNAILQEDNLYDFLVNINKTYHTRVTGIKNLVEELKKRGINTTSDLKTQIPNGLSFLDFMKMCKITTKSYTYSFATKVFSFIDETYPIVDSIVATLLDEYQNSNKYPECSYEGLPKSKWGDYKSYMDNYEAFKKAFKIERLSSKQVDKFLWTYGKLINAYWQKMGVLRFSPISFDPKTIA